nr:NAD(P)/FAD-dependent oxidoreductase [Spirochaetaceae bacterium]
IIFSLIFTENKEKSREELNEVMISQGKTNLKTLLKEKGITSALADYILESLIIPKGSRCLDLNKNTRKALISLLLGFPMEVSRKGNFSSAMVTAGGVSMGEINRHTMESRIMPGLFFAGEVMDIDGNTGGYNIHGAFATALLAEKAMIPI